MSAVNRAQLVEQVLRDQRQLLHCALQGESIPSLAQLDLTMAQLRALVIVAWSGPMPVGSLGNTLGVGKPAATLLVNTLVHRELVKRREDPDDRRRTLVQVSPHGQEFIDELLQGRRDTLSVWFERMDDGDLAALARGFRALVTVALPESQER